MWWRKQFTVKIMTFPCIYPAAGFGGQIVRNWVLNLEINPNVNLVLLQSKLCSAVVRMKMFVSWNWDIYDRVVWHKTCASLYVQDVHTKHSFTWCKENIWLSFGTLSQILPFTVSVKSRELQGFACTLYYRPNILQSCLHVLTERVSTSEGGLFSYSYG